jgi:ABC-type glycerol-3-phosphate transport system substrate-binding protein
MATTAVNRRSMVAAGVLVAAGLLGACSGHVEVGTPSSSSATSTTPAAAPGVSKEQLASVVKQRLEEKVGKKADAVVCDGDLPARVGAKQQCILTDGADQYRVTVTASDVNGGKVNFGIETDPDPINSSDPSSPAESPAPAGPAN